jgi:AraC-like DNA-binding protein
MRFTKAEIALLLPFLRLDQINWKRDGNDYKPSQTKALAFPLRLYDMIGWFGCSRSQLSTIFNMVYYHLVRVFRTKLFFDRTRLNLTKMREYAAAIDRLGGGDNIWR